tara:strand:- start:7325 stop:9154 length:1830 start_codon:yes stop_codon:yes gene_type:complete
MVDIEDLSKSCSQFSFENKLHTISYDDEKLIPIIDHFTLNAVKSKIYTWKKLETKMREFQKFYKIQFRKADLVASYKKLNLNDPKFYKIILKRAMRSQSGVLVVTVFTHAFPEYTDSITGLRKKQMFSCKHNCYYCPSEPAREENGWIAQPRSYLAKEPGVARACTVNYDCVEQVNLRIHQYLRMGHTIDKLEVLVLGGTFSEYPSEYQKEFIRDIYFAANNSIYSNRKERFPLETELLLNENAKIKVIGLTLETRPDTIDIDEIAKFRSFGCTRIQMGLQHTNDNILKMSNRGHKLIHTIKAISLLKDNCFKVDIHLMPNLLGSSPEKDIEMFDKILYDPELQADQIKIYPVSVVPWSVYETMYKNGKYVPYSDEKLKKVIIYIKKRIHPWVRLNRVIRDIPISYISGGCSQPNMRQSLSKLCKCKCIRCREVKGRKIGKAYRKVRKYISSKGTEFFISYESFDESILYGFIRLRIPPPFQNKTFSIFSELVNCALIRELHVYGDLSGVGQLKGSQHKGFGTKLLKDAEFYAIVNGYTNICVISGNGVRNYYRNRGYTITTKHGYLKKSMGLSSILLNLILGIYNYLIDYIHFVCFNFQKYCLLSDND